MSFDRQKLLHAGGIDPTVRRRETGLLFGGFLVLTATIVLAHLSPATGYEVSVYTGTPALVWAGLAVAFAAAIAVALARPPARLQLGALLLGGETAFTVFALPVIRGYQLTSAGDVLTHMGWIRNVLRGEMTLAELIYPGPHTVAIYFNRLLGLELTHSMQLTVLVMAAAFLLFVPTATYVLTDDLTTAVVATFAAAMILPINNISIHPGFFPSTMAVFFAPFVLLLAAVALDDLSGRWVTPLNALVAVGSVGLVLMHPQQAANLLLVFVTVSVAATAYHYYHYTKDRVMNPLYGHTNFLALAILLWGISHERVSGTALAYVEAVIGAFLESDTASGGSITQRTGSLSAIGVSPVEIALKLFLPEFLFIGLTGVVFVKFVLRPAAERSKHLKLAAVGLGLAPVGIVMVLYMLGNLQTIYFRHLGFIMALVTVFGAVAVAGSVDRGLLRRYGRVGVAASGALLAVLIVVSFATVFPSPFIYQPNGQVTESGITGHETAFAYENESIEYAGIRSGPNRYRDAIEGTYRLDFSAERREARVPFGRLGDDLTEVFDGPRYVVVTEDDVQRETLAYRGLRYSETGFERVGTHPGVDRVVSNGEFTLYHVRE